MSLLKQERIIRHWSRAYVEKLTNIPQRSLENWEEGIAFPRSENIETLCELYKKSAEQLELVKSHGIMGTTITVYAPQEGTPMSEIIRREVFCDLGSRLSSLIDIWPKRNYHYGELQAEINKAIFDHHALAGKGSIYEVNRRQVLKSVGLVPIQLCAGLDGVINLRKAKADTDTLLKHCAAGVAVCWYMRRGKELVFTNDLVSEYVKVLQQLMYSKSEAHQKAAATLLTQCFRLKGSLSRDLESEGDAHYLEAVRYAEISGSSTEQAITQRIIGTYYLWNDRYTLSLPYAEKAYGIMKSHQDMSRNARSYIASGLSLCQSANGKEAKTSLKEGLDLFDPTDSMPSMPFSESILTAVAAAVHQHIGNWQESIDLYKKSLIIPDISALGSVQTRINYAKTEVNRDDKPRDMGLCVQLLTEGIAGAKELGSERYIREARACYNLLRLVWQHEQAIKTLGREHFGLN